VRPDLVVVLLPLLGQHPRFQHAPDNGPEFIAQALRWWLSAASVETLDVELGAPWENGYAESFHSKVPDELLDREEFRADMHRRSRVRNNSATI